jgi:NADH-quinone oxidoreductase subunit J
MSLIIYAGAIAILFLFVIMMLNIKVLEVTSFYKEKKQYIPLAVLALGCVLLLMLISLINIYHPQYIESQVVEYDTTYVNYFQHINDFSTLVSLAAVLYDSLYFFVIIAAIILFLAMIAAIALTLKIRKKFLKQKVFVQLLRDFNKTVTVNNDSVKI